MPKGRSEITEYRQGGTGLPIDAFEMALIHRVFRSELTSSQEIIHDVRAGDVRHSMLVADHVGNILAALHHHHAAEDELLWPKLVTRMPSCADEVKRMEDAHADIAGSLDKLHAVRAAWATTADREFGEQLIAALSQLADRLDVHLTDEEHVMVPLISKHLAPDDWRQVLGRGASFINRKNFRFGLVLATLVLETASSDERPRFLAGLPLPLRLMVRLFGNRVSRSYWSELHRSPHR